MDKGTCSVEDCERPVKTKGFCQGCYIKQRRAKSKNGPCLIEGCTRPWQTQGYCGNHYNQARKNGLIGKLPDLSEEERFFAKVNKETAVQLGMDEPCWIWFGATSTRGDYGKFVANDVRGRYLLIGGSTNVTTDLFPNASWSANDANGHAASTRLIYSFMKATNGGPPPWNGSERRSISMARRCRTWTRTATSGPDTNSQRGTAIRRCGLVKYLRYA